MSKKIRLFIASSSKLMEQRNRFEVNIAGKNKILIDEKDVFIELIRWEDMSAFIQQDRLQNIYNEEIKVCDIFILLISDKIGKFTKEEFEVALDTYKRKNKPKILTFFDKSVKTTDNSIEEFKKELEELGHFYAFYNSFEDFWIKLNKQLDVYLKCFSNKLIENKIPKQIGTLPPFNPKIFLGREGVTKKIYNVFFKNDKQVLLLSGNGGIGKTTVASKYYYEYQNVYIHQIWVFNESEIANTIMTLATELQVKFSPDDTKEQSVLKVLKRLNELDKPTLLIIDNVDNIDDLEKNYQYLLSSPKLHILLTSRVQDFELLENYNIDKLSKDTSKELFIKYYKNYKESESELLDRVLEMVDYNTLAIEALSKNLNQFNKLKSYTLQNMLNDIINSGFLKIKAKDINTLYHKLNKKTPQEIFVAMYNLSNLSLEEIKTLSIISLVPAVSIPFEELEIFIDVENLDEILLKLYNTSWLDYNEENSTFSINPIVAEIVRDKNKDSLYKYAQKFIYEVTYVLDYRGWEGELENYHKAAIYISYAELIFKYLNNDKKAYYDLSFMADRIGKFYFSHSSLSQAFKYYEENKRLKQALYESNKNNLEYKDALAVAFERCGDIYSISGNMDEALKYYINYNRLKKELSKTDKKNIEYKYGLAVSFERLGNIYIAFGKIGKAINYYKKLNIILKKIYHKNKNNLTYKKALAVSYERLGDIYDDMGKSKKSLYYYKKCNKLMKKLLNSKKINVKYSLAISYGKLGNIYTTIGKFKKAFKCYNKSHKLVKSLYQNTKNNFEYKYGLAISHKNLGDLYFKIRKLNKAMLNYEKSNILIKELYEINKDNLKYKNNLAISYINIYDIYIKLKNNSKAKYYINKSYDLYKELIIDDSKNVEYRKNFNLVKEFKQKIE